MSIHFDNLKKHFPDLSTSTVLDLGSGRGNFLLEAAQEGVCAYGLEKNQEYIRITLDKAEKLNYKVEVTEGVGEEMPYTDNFFDFINISEVLEHVDNPQKVLQEVYRVLKKDGGAYISVPNRYGVYDPHFHLYGINWMPRKMAHWVIGLLKKHKVYTNDAGKQRIDQMYYDTKRGFTKKAKSAGFTVVDTRWYKVTKVKNPLKRFLMMIAYRILSPVLFQTNHFIVHKSSERSVKKILVLTNSLDNKNGWGRYTNELLSQFQKQGLGYKVFVNDTTDKDAHDSKKVGLYTLRAHSGVGVKNLGYALIDGLMLCREARKYDAVHSFVEHHAYTAFLLGKPFFVTIHGTFLIRFLQVPFLKIIVTFVFSRAQNIIAISEFTKQKVLDLYPFKNIIFIPNGVNVNVFKKKDNQNRKPFFMTVGAVKPRKAQDIGIKVLQKLHKKYEQLSYIIVGKKEFGEYYNELQKLIDEGGLKDKVYFIFDASDEKIIELYNQTTAFLLASRVDATGAFEGFPLTFLEAGACGAPIIGTYGCGSEHIIIDGENGFLVQQEDVDGLSNKLASLLEDQERLARMSNCSYDRARSFSWENHMNAIMELYATKR